MLYQAELFPDRSFTPMSYENMGARQERAYNEAIAGWQAGNLIASIALCQQPFCIPIL